MTETPDQDASKPGVGEWLEAGEDVVAGLTGDSASLFVTERRMVIVREGHEFRPRSGIRSWTFDTIDEVSLSRAKRGQARIVIRTGPYPWQAISMFFASEHGADAAHVISEIRKRMRLDHGPRKQSW